MSPENFEMLLSWIGPKIKKVTTKMREPIRVDQRFCIVLKYLVTGDAHVTVAASYGMSSTTVGHIVKKTCALIWNILCDKGYVSPYHQKKLGKKFRKARYYSSSTKFFFSLF